MSDIVIRRAEEKDLQKVDELLFQVNKVHSDARPDLFKPGAKKSPFSRWTRTGFLPRALLTTVTPQATSTPHM